MDEEEHIQNTLPEQDREALKKEGIEIMGNDVPGDQPEQKNTLAKEMPDMARAVAMADASIRQNKIAPQETDGVRALRTYEGDMADAVAQDHISAVKMAAAESDRRAHTDAPIDKKEERGSRTVLFAAIAIGILAVIVGVGGYFLFERGSALPSQGNLLPASLVDVTSVQKVVIENNEDAASDFSTKIKSLYFPVGSVAQIVPVTADNAPIATSTVFLSALGINVPQQILQSLGTAFTFGVYTSTENHPFLILTVESFDDAFAGMLSWEKTMNEDLGSFIATDHGAVVLSGSGPVFRDTTILNKDIRELDDASNTPELLYSFTDTHTLVITTDKDTMSQVITRLDTAQVAR